MKDLFIQPRNSCCEKLVLWPRTRMLQPSALAADAHCCTLGACCIFNSIISRYLWGMVAASTRQLHHGVKREEHEVSCALSCGSVPRLTLQIADEYCTACLFSRMYSIFPCKYSTRELFVERCVLALLPSQVAYAKSRVSGHCSGLPRQWSVTQCSGTAVESMRTIFAADPSRAPALAFRPHTFTF